MAKILPQWQPKTSILGITRQNAEEKRTELKAAAVAATDLRDEITGARLGAQLSQKARRLDFEPIIESIDRLTSSTAVPAGIPRLSEYYSRAILDGYNEGRMMDAMREVVDDIRLRVANGGLPADKVDELIEKINAATPLQVEIPRNLIGPTPKKTIPAGISSIAIGSPAATLPAPADPIPPTIATPAIPAPPKGGPKAPPKGGPKAPPPPPMKTTPSEQLKRVYEEFREPEYNPVAEALDYIDRVAPALSATMIALVVEYLEGKKDVIAFGDVSGPFKNSLKDGLFEVLAPRVDKAKERADKFNEVVALIQRDLGANPFAAVVAEQMSELAKGVIAPPPPKSARMYGPLAKYYLTGADVYRTIDGVYLATFEPEDGIFTWNDGARVRIVSPDPSAAVDAYFSTADKKKAETVRLAGKSATAVADAIASKVGGELAAGDLTAAVKALELKRNKNVGLEVRAAEKFVRMYLYGIEGLGVGDIRYEAESGDFLGVEYRYVDGDSSTIVAISIIINKVGNRGISRIAGGSMSNVDTHFALALASAIRSAVYSEGQAPAPGEPAFYLPMGRIEVVGYNNEDQFSQIAQLAAVRARVGELDGLEEALKKLKSPELKYLAEVMITAFNAVRAFAKTSPAIYGKGAKKRRKPRITSALFNEISRQAEALPPRQKKQVITAALKTMGLD